MGLIRWKATNDVGTMAYYKEPYTVQHFFDFLKDQGHLWFVEIPQALWAMRSKSSREKTAHAYNEAMFGWVPQEQSFVIDENGSHLMTDDERRKWLGR